MKSQNPMTKIEGDEKKYPRVGIGVMILREDRILLGKRKGAHEEGTWCIPGGHLEYGEEFKEGAEREVLEETGLRVKNIRYGTVTNSINLKEDKHYVSIILVADYDKGEAEILEPGKCEEWRWFDLVGLPEKMCSFMKQSMVEGFLSRITNDKLPISNET